MGTYRIEETNPSEGYLIDPTVYDIHCDYEGQNVEVVIRNQSSKEQVKKQAFQIIKVSTEGSEESDLVANAEFTVKLTSEVNQVGWDKARTYNILTTDKKGYAKSIELPYGTYTVKETKVPDEMMPVEDFQVVITEDSREPQVWRVFNDAPFKALIKAVKVDQETGKTVLLPDTTFKIKNLQTNKYVGQWVWFPVPHYVTEFKTDETGTVTTPNTLEVGEYQLEEIHAPYGYVLDTAPVKFKVTNQNQYQLAEDGTPIIVAYKQDLSVKGQITVTKQGEVLVGYEDNQFIYETRGLADMKANVYAKENIMDPSNDGTILYKAGELVETLTTDSTGKATTKKLPLGKYTVKEVQAPHGYVINKTEYDVELKYKDENTPLVFETVGYENDRQKVYLSLYKKNAEQTTMLAGGEFDIIADQDIQNIEGEVIVTKGTVLDHIITDTNGYATTDLDLPLDKNFAFVETKAPIGYILDETPIPFVTEYEGQDYQEINVAKEALNEETKIVVSKLDMTTSEELPGNVMKIFEKDNEGSTFITWISTDKPQEITNLDVNTRYILRETSAAKGHQRLFPPLPADVPDHSEHRAAVWHLRGAAGLFQPIFRLLLLAVPGGQPGGDFVHLHPKIKDGL